ncbi:MFS transporter [Streptomyces orinoci]|uniref:MFS transporter n=2 Tax=Streptomyces orinoci TaxID=67339 RepID=A0ABV3K4R9_STRON|nr:MFS transporter [Streptomyces orinoci]
MPFLAVAYAFTVAMCGTTLPTPLYGLYQRQLGFSSLMVTVIFAVYAIGVILALLLLGQLSDSVGRKPVLLAGLVLSALSALCFLLEGGLPGLFAGRVLSGLSAGLFTGTATAAVVELAPRRWAGAAALAATAANMGGLGSGPLLAGLLARYAPDPLRWVFAVDLMLVAVAVLVLLPVPETVPRRRGVRLRPRRLRVPRPVRPAFVPAAMAGFAGFATLGLFTSVAPSFLSRVVGVNDPGVSGAVVCAVFAASTGGQLLMGRIGVRRALPWGCVVLVAGMAVIFGSLATASLPLLVAGAVIAGLGQGLSFRAGVTMVSEQSPPERRAEVNSALFVVLYVAISLPVVGVGVMAVTLGLRQAGLVFTGCVALLAAATAVLMALRPVAPGGDAA